jgi:hypothetical protein
MYIDAVLYVCIKYVDRCEFACMHHVCMHVAVLERSIRLLDAGLYVYTSCVCACVCIHDSCVLDAFSYVHITYVYRCGLACIYHVCMSAYMNFATSCLKQVCMHTAMCVCILCMYSCVDIMIHRYTRIHMQAYTWMLLVSEMYV